MIIVTGGAGQLGRAVVEELLARISPARVGVSVRDAAKASDLAARGVRVRQATFDDAASVREAFDGATQVLIVSSNAAATGGDPIPQHRVAIDAARDAGAARIVYTSQISSSPTSAFSPAQDHAKTERMLAASGVPFGALRNGFYATHALGVIAGALKTGEIVAPEDGKVSWTAHADLAAAAAVILAEERPLDGPTAPLTGGEALDFADLAAIASEIAGRPITRVTVSDADFKQSAIARGMPASAADFMLGMYVASRRGEFAAVDPTLAQLIGRKPITMRALAQRAAG